VTLVIGHGYGDDAVDYAAAIGSTAVKRLYITATATSESKIQLANYTPIKGDYPQPEARLPCVYPRIAS
jgi:hypothetical protein